MSNVSSWLNLFVGFSIIGMIILAFFGVLEFKNNIDETMDLARDYCVSPAFVEKTSCGWGCVDFYCVGSEKAAKLVCSLSEGVCGFEEK